MEDMVNHPKHYTSHPSGVECIEITRHMNFNIGNAIKYLWRSGLKKPEYYNATEREVMRGVLSKEIQDLQKAVWYIDDQIRLLNDKLQNTLET